MNREWSAARVRVVMNETGCVQTAHMDTRDSNVEGRTGGLGFLDLGFRV